MRVNVTGASLAGAQAALCNGNVRGNSSANKVPSLKSEGLDVSGGAAAKKSDNYVDRLVTFIQLMDPRHTLTTESQLRRYQALLKEHNAGKVRVFQTAVTVQTRLDVLFANAKRETRAVLKVFFSLRREYVPDTSRASVVLSQCCCYLLLSLFLCFFTALSR